MAELKTNLASLVFNQQDGHLLAVLSPSAKSKDFMKIEEEVMRVGRHAQSAFGVDVGFGAITQKEFLKTYSKNPNYKPFAHQVENPVQQQQAQARRRLIKTASTKKSLFATKKNLRRRLL